MIVTFLALFFVWVSSVAVHELTHVLLTEKKLVSVCFLGFAFKPKYFGWTETEGEDGSNRFGLSNWQAEVLAYSLQAFYALLVAYYLAFGAGVLL